MVIAINERNTRPSALYCDRRALTTFLAMNELMRRRIDAAGIKRARSPCDPANFANIAARASA